MSTGWEIQEITKYIMINGKQKHGSHTYLKFKIKLSTDQKTLGLPLAVEDTSSAKFKARSAQNITWD